MESEKKSSPQKPEAPFPKEGNDKPAGKKESKSFLDVVKKVGFSVWLAVMVIGGILAFLTSLLLL